MTEPPLLLCVTPNLAVDRTLVVPGFCAGGVWRAERVLAMAGGKGVNVARAARTLGYRALCAGLNAGPTGDMAASAAAAEGLPAHWTETAGDSRVCVILVDPQAGATVVNEPGRPVAPEAWAALAADVTRLADSADVVCLSGSLPPGVPAGGFAALIAGLRAGGRPVWVDSSGAALAEAADAAPFGLKVNHAEAGQLTGTAIETPDQAAGAARALQRRGIAMVAITLGGGGAVLAGDGGACRHAAAPPVREVSAVGSGDAFLAGLAGRLAAGGAPEAALREAVGAGAANVRDIGGGVFAAEDARQLAEAATLRRLDGV